MRVDLAGFCKLFTFQDRASCGRTSALLRSSELAIAESLAESMQCFEGNESLLINGIYRPRSES